MVYVELSGKCCTQSTNGAMSSTNPQQLGVLSPIPPQQRGQHSPQCNQLHQGWLTLAQERDNTFDLLQLGLYVLLALFLGFHQEIDLLFFGENIIRVDLPRQNPSDNPLAQVMAWPCSPNPLQETQVWVALGRFNNTGKKKSSSCSHFSLFQADADPKPLSTLSMAISAHSSVQKSVACGAPAPAPCHPSPAVLGVPAAHAELSRQGLAAPG